MLTYKQYGNERGPLLVFLHGGGVGSWMWDKQIEHFSQYHCVTIDLPEHGFNRDKGPFSINDSAQKIIDIIEHIANGRTIIVVGFSLGAQVLIKMLSMRNNLIHFAMINSALVRPSKFNAKIMTPLIHLTYPLIKNKTFAKQQAKALLIADDYFDIYYEESKNVERETLIRILRENMLFSFPQQFKDTMGKILVTVGDKEKSVMKKSAFDIVNSNQNCIGITFTNVGHGAPFSEPELFNHILEQWLNEKFK